jgi:hypothetical protein
VLRARVEGWRADDRCLPQACKGHDAPSMLTQVSAPQMIALPASAMVAGRQARHDPWPTPPHSRRRARPARRESPSPFPNDLTLFP